MWETSKKPAADYSVTGLKSVHDMIRTRGLLIRSQTLYPAELHAHIKVVGGEGFEPSKAELTDLQSAPFGHSGTRPYTKQAPRSHK